MKPLLFVLFVAFCVKSGAADGRVITENGTNILAVGIDGRDYEVVRFYLKGTNLLEFRAGGILQSTEASVMPQTWGSTNLAGHAGITNATRLPVFRWRDVFTNKFVTFQAGANVTLTDEGTNIVIAATAGGGGGDAGGTNSRQFGTLTLTNLSGNPNVATQILAGANITVTSNNAGIYTITGSGGGGSTETIARATANIVNTNTAYVNATNLTFAVAANTTYRFRFVVHYTTAATTTGIRFAVNGPAAPAALRVGGVLPTGTAAMNSGSQTAYNTDLFAATTGPGATAVTGVIEGVFRNGANAGTLALRVSSEIANSAVTILADSYGELQSF